MLYDSENRKIKISLDEFLGITLRGIAPTLPFDEDATRQEEIALGHLKYISPDIHRDDVTYDFHSDGLTFELHLKILHVVQTEIIIAKEVEGNPHSFPKHEMDTLRAEGLLIAKVTADLEGSKKMCISYYLENRDLGLRFDTRELYKKEDLDEFFSRAVDNLIKYARPEVERVTERLPSFSAVKFPFEKVRDGQREFMREAYRAFLRGSTVFATAPTGTGKTISAIYPALKALAKGKAEKIFYLTPKGTTAVAAQDAINSLSSGGAKIKSLIISPKDRICMNGHACRVSRKFCKFSSCSKIADAALKLYQNVNNCLHFKDILVVAREFGVCPYELSLAYSELCDIVICDFNYLFDPGVYLRRFFDKGGRYIFLIDESHNLVERTREMYSAALEIDKIDEPDRSEILCENTPLKAISRHTKNELFATLYPFIKDELVENKEGKLVGATHLSFVPIKLYQTFEKLEVAIDEQLREAIKSRDEEQMTFLREYRQKIKKFHEAIKRFDENYKLILFYNDGQMRTEILALHTGKQVKKMLQKGHAALLFSATLQPINYYKAALGGENSDPVLAVESPFAKEQLAVAIMDKISTRFSERQDTLLAVCKTIAATVSAKKGNYIIFSPSFDYSAELYKAFKEKYPQVRTLFQHREMTPSEKKSFIDEFEKPRENYLIGFAVMGGIYSEGIDLVGDSLIGAIIVGIGMPGLSYQREAIAEFYEEKYEEGKQFAYIYPGMNRVFQAAGRVIRREDDRGVIVLIDDRFDDPIYKKSLPKLWGKVKFIGDAKTLNAELKEFWKGVSEENNKQK